jgi:transcription elongation factor Elf1
MNTEKAALHEAYFWDCPECGREQFSRTIRVGVTEEEEEDVASYCILMPDTVECRYCGTEFETLLPHEDYPDDLTL